MNIIVAGGTGFIGQALVKKLLEEGNTVVLLTRNPNKVKNTHPSMIVELWNANTVNSWARHIDGSEVIINLTGEPIVGKRWSESHKKKILSSRVQAIRTIISAIKQTAKKPSVLVSTSGVGFYGNVLTDDVTESSPKGHSFLSDVCQEWEQEALKAQKFGVRVVTPRLGVVLAHDGGALQPLMLLFKLFAGGYLGSGKQWFPWIHRDDVVNAILYIFKSSSLYGAVNFVSPELVNMKKFCREVAKALHRPMWGPIPAIALRLVLGEMVEMLLTGQRAIPKKLLDAGYEFLYPKLEKALQSIVTQSLSK